LQQKSNSERKKKKEAYGAKNPPEARGAWAPEVRKNFGGQEDKRA